MASAKTEIAVGWLTVGLVFGGAIGLTVHNPEPEVHEKTKIEVVHVPSTPKVYTRKEVETKYVQKDMPDSCKNVTKVIARYTSLANQYDMLAKKYYDAVMDKQDALSLFDKREALNGKLYEVLQQKEEVTTAQDICENDINLANE